MRETRAVDDLCLASSRLLAVFEKYDVLAKMKREWLLGGAREFELFESAVDHLRTSLVEADRL